MIQHFSTEKKLWNTYRPIIQNINALENEFSTLLTSEIKERIGLLKNNMSTNNAKLTNSIITNTFALTREASKRTLGLRHYDTQLLGGLILNEGKIAEMATGEGKTLVASCPAATNALSTEGVHIITVNEYLAQRDMEWMQKIYQCLGLTVGLIKENMPQAERKQNYLCDITYITNTEIGFDFLRDNLVTETNEITQRRFNFCIIDEIDSVLIDEARTPIIISTLSKVRLDKFFKADQLITRFKENLHFELDEKTKTASLTELGFYISKVLLKVDNLYATNDPWIGYILNAIRAKCLFLRNIDYIVQNNEVVIIDKFTGRSMEGRKWGEGLHQAIEAKEGLTNLQKTKTLASITYQNLFRLYPKLSGMTGTAKTEQLEFENTYNLAVVVLPTFKPIIRKDLSDLIYFNQFSKWKAICLEVKEIHKTGRPILVGTTTIENSEIFSFLLAAYEIPHQLLNAKPETTKLESQIIAQAGCLNSITISTNMAGRGTDILLGGNPEFKARSQFKKLLQQLANNEISNISLDSNVKNIFYTLINYVYKNYSNQILELCTKKTTNNYVNFLTSGKDKIKIFDQRMYQIYEIILDYYKKKCEEQAKIIKELGGLYVIGSERHESRRIDNQLRGRAGRQGDPGSSRFFVSLEDPLLKIFGGKNVASTVDMLNLKKTDQALESQLFSNLINSAQEKIESHFYNERKNLDKYDQVLNQHRFYILNIRKKIVFSSRFKELILSFMESFIDELIDNLKIIITSNVENNLSNTELYSLLSIMDMTVSTLSPQIKNLENFRAFLYRQAWSVYDTKEYEFGAYEFE
ncbi:MAG: preprotein translocase subunit SecA, partial [Clostridiales bacterium]